MSKASANKASASKPSGGKPLATALQDKSVELVKSNDIESLKSYLEEYKKDKIINKLDTKNGKNALIVASEEGKLDIIELLVKTFKANVNYRGKNGNTALIEAASNGEYDACKLLLSYGCNINAIGMYGDTALHAACKKNWPGHIETVKAMIFISDTAKRDAAHNSVGTSSASEGRSANNNYSNNSSNAADSERGTVSVDTGNDLHVDGITESATAAAAPTLVATTSNIILDLTVKNLYDETSLATAFKYCVFESIEILLASGYDINTLGTNGNSLACRAAFDGRIPLLSVFIKNNGDITIRNCNDESPFLIACKAARIDVISYLIKNCNINVNEVDSNGRTALMFACMTVKLTTFNVLINEYSADVHMVDNWGYNALMFVCKHSDKKAAVDMIKVLLQRGIDVNHIDKNYNNALHYCCMKGSIDAIKLLLDNGADDFMKNIDEKKPFDYLIDEDVRKDIEAYTSVLRGNKIYVKDCLIPYQEKPIWLQNLNAGDGWIPEYRLTKVDEFDFVDVVADGKEAKRLVCIDIDEVISSMIDTATYVESVVAVGELHDSVGLNADVGQGAAATNSYAINDLNADTNTGNFAASGDSISTEIDSREVDSNKGRK